MSRRRHATKPEAGVARPRRVDALAVLALAVLALGVFAGSLSAGFVRDDHLLVAGRAEMPEHWDPWRSRSLRTFSVMADHALFGDEPAGYHAQSLLWHALCAVLAYRLVLTLARRRDLAWLAAALFAVHPVQVEAVTSIANRKELLYGAFCMAAFLAYARAAASAGRARWGWTAAAALAWVVALYGKQVAVALPVALVAYDWLFLPRERRLLGRSPALVAAGAAAGSAAVLFLLVTTLDLDDLRAIGTFDGYLGTPTIGAVTLTSARSFWAHLELLVWPAGVCPDHVMELSTGLAEPRTLLAWSGLAGFAGLAVALRHRARLVSFGMVWLLAFYLPVSNLLPSAYLLADRYLYLPSLGFCIALAWALTAAADRLSLPSALRAAAAGVLLAGLATWTVAYNAHWSGEERVWRYTLSCEPRSYRAHVNVGAFEMMAGRHETAVEHFSQAIRLRPDYSPTYYNLGQALDALGHTEAATRSYEFGARFGYGPAQRALEKRRR